MAQVAVTVPFCGGSYKYRSRGVSVQRSINLYPEVIEDPDGKTRMALVYTPGALNAATIGSDADATCRGLYFSSTGPGDDSRLYACYGSRIYRINRDTTWVELGQVLPGSTPVRMTDNGFKFVVADGSALYEADLLADDATAPSTWKQVDLPLKAGGDIPIRPSQVVWIRQRLIINDANSSVFYYSNPASLEFEDEFGTQNFYSAEASADSIRAMLVSEDLIWLWGDRSYEVWTATGGSYNDPMSQVRGSSSQIGIQSYRSAAGISDMVFWLGSSDAGRNMVFMGQGLNRPQRVSTNAIENVIGSLSDADACIGWCYMEEGHTFYVLTFQNSNLTLVYDVSTGLWHERSTKDWNTGDDLSWEPLYAATAFNKVYYGSSLTNSLLLLQTNRYVDADDRPIVRQRVSPIYFADNDPISVRELYLDMEVGTTPLLSGLGRDPQAMLEVSRDGGSTWEPQGWVSIGAQGEYYFTTVKWCNLGVGRSWAMRVTFSDPSPIVLYGARILTDRGSTR